MNKKQCHEREKIKVPLYSTLAEGQFAFVIPPQVLYPCGRMLQA
jgi:hypothetical protein